jgi:hypothetical protein
MSHQLTEIKFGAVSGYYRLDGEFVHCAREEVPAACDFIGYKGFRGYIRDGCLHGPFEEESTPHNCVKGQYDMGVRTGIWEHANAIFFTKPDYIYYKGNSKYRDELHYFPTHFYRVRYWDNKPQTLEKYSLDGKKIDFEYLKDHSLEGKLIFCPRKLNLSNGIVI